MRFTSGIAGTLLFGLTFNANALDLGGMMQQVQSGLEKAQQSAAQQQPVRQAEQQPQQTGEPPATSRRYRFNNYQEKLDAREKERANEAARKEAEIKARGFYYNEEACVSAKKIIPENINKLSVIRISGYGVEPVTCLKPEFQDRCISLSDSYGDVVSYQCKEDNNYDITLDMLKSPYGLVIVSIVYESRIIEGRERVTSFYKDDAVFKSLVSRYGMPINVQNEKEPFNELVWAKQSFDFTAAIVDKRLRIKLRLDALLPELRQSLRKARDEEDKKQNEQVRQSVRGTAVPKF